MLFLASCKAPEPKGAVTTMNPEGIAGVYKGAGVTLVLRPDSAATLTTGTEVHKGRWSSLPPQLRFDFELGNRPRPESITWTMQNDALLPLIWDKSIFGPSGPVLHR